MVVYYFKVPAGAGYMPSGMYTCNHFFKDIYPLVVDRSWWIVPGTLNLED